MDSHRWRVVEELYYSVLDEPAADRPAFLARACGGDETLRRHVEALIRRTESSGGVLDKPLFEPVESLDTAPETQLGPYRLVEVVGVGGMGKVYRAIDTRLDRTVAIKMSRPEFAGRFQQEARAISSLNHPSVCTLYDVGPDYLVMEFIDGESLASRLRAGMLPIPEVLRFGTEIAAGVAEAHSAGIIHRDLKPGNVMITAAGLAKVLDFGLAKAGRPVSAAASAGSDSIPTMTLGAAAGTPAYMAPEQVDGKPADARSDVFSFGSMLYELLSGERPFKGDSTGDVLEVVLHAEPKPLNQIRPEAPIGFQQVVARCLRKDPALRFQSMVEVKAALADLGQAPVKSLAARNPFLGRWWVPAAVGASAIAVLLAWLIFGSPGRAPVQYHPVPLTSLPGAPRLPELSPDGQTVAFVWDGPNRDDLAIYLQKVGGGEPIRRVGGVAPHAGPTWSPDGRSLAFVRGSMWNWEFFVIPVLSGAERQIGRSKSPMSGVRWSPDGRYVVITDRGGPRNSKNVLYLQPLESGERRQLTFPPQQVNGDFGGGISLKGDRLTFWRALDVTFGDLYYLPLGPGYRPSRDPRPVLHWDDMPTNVADSPDGRTLFFTSAPGDAGIRRIRLGPAARPETLSLPAEFISYMSVSRQGRRMVYQRDLSDSGIWRLDLVERGPAVPVLASPRREWGLVTRPMENGLCFPPTGPESLRPG